MSKSESEDVNCPDCGSDGRYIHETVHGVHRPIYAHHYECTSSDCDTEWRV